MSETEGKKLRSVSRLAGRAQEGIARRLSIDKRALAAFRVAIGLVILVDIFMRSEDFVAFYTDEGVLPPSYLASDPLSSLSLHFLSGDARFQAFVFVVTGLFALLLVVGYRTRLATFASFVLVTSLQEYNPYILNSGDLMLRWFLFFGIFLPLGARWSVDSLKHGKPADKSVENIAAASALLYAVMIYTVNGLSKLGSDAWMSGEAVVNVLSTDKYTVFIGNYIGEFPEILVFLNWAWLALLVTSVLLVLLTWWPRFSFAAAFVGAHTGMLLTMQLAVFPLVAISILVLFMPPVFWDRVEPLARRFDVREEHARNVRNLLWADAEPVTPRRVCVVVGDVAPLFVGVILLTGVVWQAEALGYGDVPDAFETVAEPTRESWTLFAPNPPDSDNWFLAPATLESGKRVDLLHLTDEELDRPPDAGGTYPSARWRKYLTHSTFEDDEDRVERLAVYLCRRGEEHYESDPVNVTVYEVWQHDPVEDPETTYRDEIVSRDCAG